MDRPQLAVASLMLVVVLVIVLGGVGLPWSAAATEQATTVHEDWAVGWQVSAPRPGLDRPTAGAPIELGLRQRFAQSEARATVAIEVRGPDGRAATSELTLMGDAWSFVTYPDVFAGASSVQPGVYQVCYLLNGQEIVADGFTVE